MIKTQVQIPDQLYREAKRIAVQYEMSFADVVRRGLERVVPSFPPLAEPPGDWQLPKLDLGLLADPFTDPEWRSALHVAPSFVREPGLAKKSSRRKRPR